MTIQDKCFGKYEIEWTDCYTVIENGIAIDAITKEKKPKKTSKGYYSTRAGAVDKICNLLTQDSFDPVAIATLKEVNDRHKQIWEEIKHTITA